MIFVFDKLQHLSKALPTLVNYLTGVTVCCDEGTF